MIYKMFSYKVRGWDSIFFLSSRDLLSEASINSIQCIIIICILLWMGHPENLLTLTDLAF